MDVDFRGFHGPSDWDWVRSHIDIKRVEDTNGIMAFNVETKDILGAAIFDNWTHISVQGHFIVDNPVILRHGFLQEICDYVFNQAEMAKIIALVPDNNTKALKLNAHMGFREIARIPDTFMYGVGVVIMEGTREDAMKWLPEPAKLAVNQ